jgi:ADP-ribose pyrophosphatase
MLKPRLISSRRLYSGRLVRLDLLQVRGVGDRIHDREVVRHPGAVAIVPLLDGKVLLVRQYRAPIDKEIWELPAGTIEPGEEPLECAKRELEEETGYRAREWRKWRSSTPPPGSATSGWPQLCPATARLTTG